MYEINRNEHLEQNASKITKMVSSTLPQESTSEEVTIGYNGVFEVLIIGAASLAGFCFLYKKSKLYLDRSSRLNINLFKRSQASCSKCRFFDRTLDSSFNGGNPRNGLSRNAYLKCAVHPVRVGKPEAKDCTDYWQTDRRKFFHR